VFAEIELEEHAVQPEPDRFVGRTPVQVVDQLDDGSLHGDLSSRRGCEFPRYEQRKEGALDIQRPKAPSPPELRGI